MTTLTIAPRPGVRIPTRTVAPRGPVPATRTVHPPAAPVPLPHSTPRLRALARHSEAPVRVAPRPVTVTTVRVAGLGGIGALPVVRDLRTA